MHYRAKKLIDDIKRAGVTDGRVLQVMGDIPREQFLARALQGEAYDNKALPIGESQTISMPTVVALMTESLDIQSTHRVLEIGTGCGYQTAVLCKLARRVFSVERHRSLSENATKRLTSMGYHNFITQVGDGSLGWSQQAPFDRIIVTAGAPKVPQSLVDQLRVGGILVIPVGPHEHQQQLVKITKISDDEIEHEDLGSVVFVPLVGAQGVSEVRK